MFEILIFISFSILFGGWGIWVGVIISGMIISNENLKKGILIGFIIGEIIAIFMTIWTCQPI